MTRFPESTWDYIIVGAGSAGCALAYELAKSGRKETILILEAGSPDRSFFFRVAAGQGRAVAGHDWGYRSQPDPSRHGATEAWTRGRVLGGSSSINGTMYVRGAAQDFDRWAKACHGTGGWSAAEVMPIFSALEASDQASSLRGHRGPLHVRTVRKPHALTTAFIESAVACGYRFNEDYNGATQEGIAYAQLSQRKGWRRSAADAFLKPLLGRENIKLLLNAQVQRIEFEQGRAVGVCCMNEGRSCRHAARKIILCAGAIASPQLLMLSGVGDREELRRHGIDAVVNLPSVGRNLREHPLLRLTYRTQIPSNNLTGGLLQKLRIAAEFATSGEGPISNLFEGTAFLKAASEAGAPDIQLHFMTFGQVMTPDGSFQLAPFPAVTVLLNKSHPVSSGRIRLASRNGDDAPLIECRLLENEADVDTMVQGIETIRRIMGSEPIANLITDEVMPGRKIAGGEALQDYVRRYAGIAFHPAGTCRMGIDADAVVGPDLRVRGVENLWIADASIMPDLVSGNTNAVCMMIGAKLGRQLTASDR